MNPYKKPASCFVLVYDCLSEEIRNLHTMPQLFDFEQDSASLYHVLHETDVFSSKDADLIYNTLTELSTATEPSARYLQCYVKHCNGQTEPCRVGFVTSRPQQEIALTFTSLHMIEQSIPALDSLTGLRTQPAFTRDADDILSKTPLSEREYYTLIYFDVQRFKIINDMFGTAEGDLLLKHIANVITNQNREKGISCRIGSDRFVIMARIARDQIADYVEALFDSISAYPLPFEIACNAGIYVFTEEIVSADAAIGRAIMAQTTVKGSYTRRFSYYTESLRKDLFTEQEITGLMRTALKEEQFIVYFQPQYNHSTGMLVGAEALVRWHHPERGLISPGIFIPVFEKNGFITTLDLYVFDKVCRYIRKCMDDGTHIVPISTNLTRYDIFSPNFIDKLENSRQKYNVPSQFIRIEITESAALGNSEFINDAVRKLHNFGYIVEMDDFGSGYSSLNILKDIDFDIIKLDMKFLQSESDNANRGGTILSSVVRKVNWLGLPIIAEGVETIEQADFLRSIGCNIIQGYLYSRPLPENDFQKLTEDSQVGVSLPQMRLIDTMNAANFWSSDSIETLIFSNFVGGAAIFDYHNGKAEILRVNKKYIQELCMNLSEKELVNFNIMDSFDEEGQEIYRQMLKRAIETEDEQESETWRHLQSSCCSEEDICIRSTVRMIGKSKDSYLFYAMIRNVTAEKKLFYDIQDSERRFQIASEQIDIYYWEYNIASHEMRPCFRCMKNLGLPPILQNYPESAIERGIIPEDHADMYRDWHKQLAEGVKSLEAVIPLTPERIPFRVRYTTEFDEHGRPIKAYASAALVVE